MKSTRFLAFKKVKQERQRGQEDNGAGPQSQDQQAQSDFRGVGIAHGQVRCDEVGILRQAPPDKDECDRYTAQRQVQSFVEIFESLTQPKIMSAAAQ